MGYNDIFVLKPNNMSNNNPFFLFLGQVLLNYDRVYRAIENAVDDYLLKKPKLMQNDFIDRKALTFYNNRQVC